MSKFCNVVMFVIVDLSTMLRTFVGKYTIYIYIYIYLSSAPLVRSTAMNLKAKKNHNAAMLFYILQKEK
jgi:hypothetical protein